MSTRSTIIVQLSNGTFNSSYCHFDGYLDGVGKTLRESYTTQEKVEALSALGPLSVLEASIEKPEGHSFEKQVKGHTVAYGRDRGEDDVAALNYPDLETALKAGIEEYGYVWTNGAWFAVDHEGKQLPLTAELTEEQLAAGDEDEE